MARRATKTDQAPAETQPEVSPDTEQDETTSDTEQPDPGADNIQTAKTTARMVEATLKTRHCRGGTCRESGETMAMTQGEYDRLKKYGRVE